MPQTREKIGLSRGDRGMVEHRASTLAEALDWLVIANPAAADEIEVSIVPVIPAERSPIDLGELALSARDDFNKDEIVARLRQQIELVTQEAQTNEELLRQLKEL